MTPRQEPGSAAREVAEKIANEFNDHPYGVVYRIEALISERFREVGLEATTIMHKDLYWQAGEIERLNREIKEARAAALLEAAQIADDDDEGICNADAMCRCSSRIAAKIRGLSK